jgi:hypothetical protein
MRFFPRGYFPAHKFETEGAQEIAGPCDFAQVKLGHQARAGLDLWFTIRFHRDTAVIRSMRNPRRD